MELFVKFPGIGPRQAARFAFFLLKDKETLVPELVASLEVLRRGVFFCEQCFRSTERRDEDNVCSLCKDKKRDPCCIAVVEKESDMQNLEKTGSFHGLYHVLGGVISPLDQDSPKKVHLRELFERIKKLLDAGSVEVILATNSTTEGDMTARYIERILAPLQESYAGLTISRLGRGLSLGSELEHVDEITLKSALSNRK